MVLKKFLIIFLLASCAPMGIPYTPEDIEMIEYRAALEVDIEPIQEIQYFLLYQEDLMQKCKKLFTKAKVVDGCAKPRAKKIFIDHAFPNECSTLIHEIFHIGLFIRDNNADDEHESALFLKTYSLCDEMRVQE